MWKTVNPDVLKEHCILHILWSPTSSPRLTLYLSPCLGKSRNWLLPTLLSVVLSRFWVDMYCKLHRTLCNLGASPPTWKMVWATYMPIGICESACWVLDFIGGAGLHLLSCAGQYFGQYFGLLEYSRQVLSYIRGCIVLCGRYWKETRHTRIILDKGSKLL